MTLFFFVGTWLGFISNAIELIGSDSSHKISTLHSSIAVLDSSALVRHRMAMNLLRHLLETYIKSGKIAFYHIKSF